MARFNVWKNPSGCCIGGQEWRQRGHSEATEIIQEETVIAWPRKVVGSGQILDVFRK